MKGKPLVGILMGSESDRPVMEKAAKVLEEFGIPFEFKTLSAHRLPDEVAGYALKAESRGLEVLIAGAGMAAHLAGALAANTTLPVIGIPLASGTLGGLDSLLSTVQMPPGVPVATVAVDGAQNAAFLALQILARKYPQISKKLKDYRTSKRRSLMQAGQVTPATSTVVVKTELAGCPPPKRGKVRDIYDLGDKILLVATDRISVFDVILPTPIPEKGKILTQISLFWFKKTKRIIANHFLATDIHSMPPAFHPYKSILDGRSMLVEKAQALPVECIVRGYLSGSAWNEYLKTGSVCGVPLPKGLKESAKLKEPIFTPSTKAKEGHDQNISFEEMGNILRDRKLAQEVKEASLALYRFASRFAEERGIIIADTKFEFGLLNGKLILIDELFTPDSSRFWPKNEYHSGGPQKSFDKQFVRDYCQGLGWDKNPPGPELPEEIVSKTQKKYSEALRLLTGSSGKVKTSSM